MGFPEVPLAFYPVAIVAILLVGIGKGGFPVGPAGLGVPMMSLFVAPPVAAGIMLPILCAMDIFGVHAYRGRWSAKHLASLVPGALIGIVIGALAFGTMPVNAIRLVVGLIAIVFSINQAFGITQRIAARLAAERAAPGRIAGTFWGALSGFTSTLAHAGGPPFAIWMMPQKLDKTTLVATSAMFFLIVNYVKLVPYWMLGQLNTGNVTLALLFAPLAPLGIWLGVWMHRRISERAFYVISYALLFATGVKLVWDGLA